MTNKPTDTSGGSALDVLPSEKLTTTDTADLAAVHRAQQVILDYLCQKYRENGSNTPIRWRGLWKELGIEEKVYGPALQGFIDAGAIDVERVGREHICLGPGGRVHCGVK